jgi:hypothetical protein
LSLRKQVGGWRGSGRGSVGAAAMARRAVGGSSDSLDGRGNNSKRWRCHNARAGVAAARADAATMVGGERNLMSHRYLSLFILINPY